MQHIIHVDMDAYYASVEQLLRPSFRSKPVVVAGNSSHSVVSAASYEARQFGIHSAMPLSKAKTLCPDLNILPVRMHIYRAFSIRIHEIFALYTPLVEALALDEAYLDVTDSTMLFGSAFSIAQEIKAKIKEATGLNCSVGIGPNKFIAKLASDQAKPSGILEITQNNAADYLADLPVRKLWGVGPKTAERLNSLGIKFVRDLRRFDPQSLGSQLGTPAERLLDLAYGIDDSPIVPHRPRKSLGHEVTFNRDLYDLEHVYQEISEISSRVGTALRKAGIYSSCIQIKIKYSNYQQRTRQIMLREATNSDAVINRHASELIGLHCNPSQGIRLLGITCSKLDSHRQDRLTANDKDQLYSGIDKIRERYGVDAILPARAIKK